MFEGFCYFLKITWWKRMGIYLAPKDWTCLVFLILNLHLKSVNICYISLEKILSECRLVWFKSSDLGSENRGFESLLSDHF